MNTLSNPEAFAQYETQVRIFGIIILVLAIAAITTVIILMKQKKISKDFLYSTLLVAVPCALIGIRVICGVSNKVAFSIGNLDIRWYGIIIVTGMIVGLLTAIVLTMRKGIKSDYALEMFLWAIPFALVGARLYYVLTTLSRGWTFVEVLDIRTGGLAIYGGLIGGIIGLFIFSRIRKVPFLKVLDIAAVSVLIGQAIGRYGNLINQEAYGIPITNEGFQFFPFGVYIDYCTASGCACGGAAHWHCATFFYESIWNLAGYAILLLWLDRKKFFTGFALCSYLIYEGIGRSIIEGLRIDSLYFLESVFGKTIRISQMLSIFMILGGLGLGAYLFIKNGKKFKLETEGEGLDSGEVKDEKIADTQNTVENVTAPTVTEDADTVDNKFDAQNVAVDKQESSESVKNTETNGNADKKKPKSSKDKK